MKIPEVAHGMRQQQGVSFLSTESHGFLIERQGPSILVDVAHYMRKCIEPANQLKSRAGLACCLDDLEESAFRIFVTPFSTRLPCHVNRILRGSHHLESRRAGINFSTAFCHAVVARNQRPSNPCPRDIAWVFRE